MITTAECEPSDRRRPLVLVSAVSGLYDIALGLLMIAGRGWLVQAFGVDPPNPPIHADLNGIFLLAVGCGYWIPWRDPEAGRSYLWVMGVALKGVGALTFLIDHAVRSSPDAYLLFALTDGSLAIVTLLALWTTSARRWRA